ncbi:hypothetical protein B0T14DRAFT_283249 [Immersiella caudata]|uniref:2EXR domain-containing protein n=1 Tax=Immersiella caudata TaxID=314043 RepID=A0AA40BU22_9PEZI|nr:hypothetical protein B0T14DRAFT_283249 [Immersiella caudata]
MATFHPFPRLPLELRQMVWEAAVPPDFGRCVFRWRPGCWELVTASPGDSDSDSDDGSLPQLAVYNVMNLGPLEIPLPLAHVNREARQIAHAWIRRNKCTLRSQDPIAVREFDWQQDAVFVPTQHWDEFLNEPSTMTDEGRDGEFETNVPLRHLVVAEEAFDAIWLGIITYPDIQKLSILHADEAQAKGRSWGDRIYPWSRQQQQQWWCELETPSPAPVASCRDGAWEIFLDNKDEDVSSGEREQFVETTRDAFAALGRVVESFSLPGIDVFRHVKLSFKSI